MDRLSQQVAEASFVVIDFETVTPKGRPPEPLELAAMRLGPGLLVDPAFRPNWLIRPPVDAPLTAFDTKQTGIRWSDIEHASLAATVLRTFEECLPPETSLLVAHYARYEAAILQRFAEHCPRAAAFSFLDTVALGKHVVPGLDNYKLDTLAQHFHLALPAQRHRALPDVELTIEILVQLLRKQLEHTPLTTIADLLQLAGIKPQKPLDEPSQMSLW